MELREAVIRWQTGSGTWPEILTRSGQPQRVLYTSPDGLVTSEQEQATLGPALPPPGGERYAFAEVLKPVDDSDAPLSWTLTVRRLPGGNPPDGVREANDRAGGLSGLKRLVDGAVDGGPIPVVDHRITFELPAASFSCPLLPRPVSKEERQILHELGQDAKVEQLGFRLRGGAEGLEEVALVFDDERRSLLLTVRVRSLLRVEEDFRLPLEQRVWGVLRGRLIREGASS